MVDEGSIHNVKIGIHYFPFSDDLQSLVRNLKIAIGNSRHGKCFMRWCAFKIDGMQVGVQACRWENSISQFGNDLQENCMYRHWQQ